uniref:Amidohydrolase-related domain-containing protein n=1 Tax=Oryza glumipatula TaxID=40148 RepID=A0A0D9ZK20_9ORYZ
MAARSCRFLYSSSSSPIATTSPLLSPTPSAATRRKLLLSSTCGTIASAAAASAMDGQGAPAAPGGKGSAIVVVDSHLHVWASPQQAAERYPYFPGQEPPIRGDVDLLLQCMDEAGVDGALIVQPINHMFDHSLVTSVLKKYPSKFIGCCLANPADDGSGIKQLEHLIVQEKYRAVRFNPNLWPSGQKMTNEVGRSLFAKAGELGAPVGIMVMKGISTYIQEIEELCTDYPKTTVIFDHMAFCKPPMNIEEEKAFTSFLELSRFPQIYVKYSALFRISREAYPYEDTSQLLSRVISSYGANRIMWGSDFPFVVPECGYKGAKEAISHVAGKIPVSSSDLEWILGKTVTQLFQGAWVSA